MRHNVSTYRAAGLEARWTRAPNGAPIIVVRDPESELPHQRDQWWIVHRDMHDTMARVGIREGFHRRTLVANFFSV